jgi:hypothetical protein
MSSASNTAMHASANSAPRDLHRVCQAWHRACGVEVPTPGVRGAEGEEKGKGVIVRRRPEEAQSKGTGRRTGTGSEVWYTWDELARASEVLHPRVGVLYQSGAYVQKVLCLTLGDRHAVRERGERSEEESKPTGMQKSAEGLLGTPWAC